MQARPGLQSLYALHDASSPLVPGLSQSLVFVDESQTHVFVPHAVEGTRGSHGIEHTAPFGTAVPAL
jgi:hypothetical protein